VSLGDEVRSVLEFPRVDRGFSSPKASKSMAPFTHLLFSRRNPRNNGLEMCTDLRANYIGKCSEKTARLRNTFSHICFVISAFQQAFVSANICHFNGKSVRTAVLFLCSVSPIGIRMRIRIP